MWCILALVPASYVQKRQVHDCWSPYFGYACEHAVCNAHILRDLKGISEDTGQRWSDEMHDLLLEIYAAVDGAPESAGSLTPVEIEEFFKDDLI